MAPSVPVPPVPPVLGFGSRARALSRPEPLIAEIPHTHTHTHLSGNQMDGILGT